jgi:hypothetical protein
VSLQWFGEAEKLVKAIFTLASKIAPTVSVNASIEGSATLGECIVPSYAEQKSVSTQRELSPARVSVALGAIG